MKERSGTTYASAGVDIDASDELLRLIGPAIARTHTDRVLRGVGHFGGFYRLGRGQDGLTLVASIDGVGTKLKVASLAGIHEGIGYDIVHHSANDIIACGANPICFLDYFAAGKLDVEVAEAVIGGIAAACEGLGVALIGGETAEMPGVYGGSDYDVAGVILGLVDQEAIIDGTSIREGDIVIGLPSRGFHTNGYSLIRASLGLNEDAATAARILARSLPWDPTHTLAEALLEPHRSYVHAVETALETGSVQGMAHITGGGIVGNLSRVVPEGLTALVDTTTWTVPRLMTYIAEQGNIEERECYRAFNMGIGFVFVCRPEGAERLIRQLDGSIRIGEIIPASTNQQVDLIFE